MSGARLRCGSGHSTDHWDFAKGTAKVHTPGNLLCRTLRLRDSSRHPKKLNAPKVFDPGQASTAMMPRPSAATKAASQRVKRERASEPAGFAKEL